LLIPYRDCRHFIYNGICNTVIVIIIIITTTRITIALRSTSRREREEGSWDESRIFPKEEA